jgi:hypothetical protein
MKLGQPVDPRADGSQLEGGNAGERPKRLRTCASEPTSLHAMTLAQCLRLSRSFVVQWESRWPASTLGRWVHRHRHCRVTEKKAP